MAMNSRVATYLCELKAAQREAARSRDGRVIAAFRALLKLVPRTLTELCAR